MNAHTNPRTQAIDELTAALADLCKYPELSYHGLQAEWSLIEAVEAIVGTDWCEARELVSEALLREHDYCTREGSFVDSEGYAIGFPMRIAQSDGSYIVKDAGL